MSRESKTAIVTGASQGMGAGVVAALLEKGYAIVANSRTITKKSGFAESGRIALVDGDIGEASTAARIAETAVGRFGSIDALVNNAGIFFTKRFIDYTAEDFGRSSRPTSKDSFTSPSLRSSRCWRRSRAGAS